jgi:hypothetical protein
MRGMKQILRIVLVAVIALQLTACSKTVQWEEEVPLNTGETIWVTREVTYRLKGGGGNPLDMAYRPDRTEEIAFEWKGKKYRYVGDAGLMLLAISPLTQQPVLVADAAFKSWDWRHDYRCTTPYYVQLSPSADGKDWSWPPSIDPWLFDLPSNLMIHREKMEKTKARYTVSDRVALDRTIAIQSPRLARIDPSYKFDQCFN